MSAALDRLAAALADRYRVERELGQGGMATVYLAQLCVLISNRIYSDMNAIRRLRDRTGLTQAQLAEIAGTSQPTIAAYEAGLKSPTLRTMQRLAEAAGLEAVVEFHRPLTREERRSLALHRAVARRLEENPDGVLAQAWRTLARMRAAAPGASQLLREWEVLLSRPMEALLPVLSDRSEWARELRHVTPFAGVLSAAERAQTYHAFAREESRAS
jgi:transcriptional regulator with XRE-family HTH domain